MKVIYHKRVWEEILSLQKQDQSIVLKVVDLLEDYGFRLSTEYLKKIGREIWELRAKEYRLLFGVIGQFGIAVNLFKKKTQKTPIKEIRLAVSRFKQYEK